MKHDNRTREELSRLPVLAPLGDRPAFNTLEMSDLRMVIRLVEHAGSLEKITEASAREVAESSDRRLDCMQRGLRRLVGPDHPASVVVSAALSRMRNDLRGNDGRDTRSRDLMLQSSHWAPFREHPAASGMCMAQFRTADRLLARYGTIEAIAEANIMEVLGAAPGNLVFLRAAFRKLVGDGHPAVTAVKMTLARQQDGSSVKRDRRPRELVLEGSFWNMLRDHPAAHSLPMNQLRLVDRFFAYCSARNLRHIEACDVAHFDKGNADQGPLQRLRNGLRALYGLHHPIVHTVEEARIAKSKAYYDAAAPAPTIGQGSRSLKYSIPKMEVPAQWLEVLTRLEAGERIQGRKAAAASVRSMRMQARYLLWAARRENLPEEFSLDTLRAYDRALDARGTRASTRAFAFDWLRMLGSFIRTNVTAINDARGVAAFYDRLASLDLPLKEDRLADLPDLAAVFDLASDLLEQASAETHSTKRATLYTDAGALALLSLIPFRNQDTVLLWGKHLTHRDGRYHLSKSITKTGATFTGKLHRILDPFFDALLLRGRPTAFLPQLREAAIKGEVPVFPKSNGTARSVNGLSIRWSERIGTGSVINRTRIHTLLGELGPEGVRAALALCAQRSYRTSEYYQAESLARNEMGESQTLLNATLPLSDEELEHRMEGL